MFAHRPKTSRATAAGCTKSEILNKENIFNPVFHRDY